MWYTQHVFRLRLERKTWEKTQGKQTKTTKQNPELTCLFVISGFLADSSEPSFGQSWSHIRGDLRHFSGQICSQTGPKTVIKHLSTKKTKKSWRPYEHDRLTTRVYQIVCKHFLQVSAPVLTPPWPNLTPEPSKKRKTKKKTTPKTLFVCSLLTPLKGWNFSIPWRTGVGGGEILASLGGKPIRNLLKPIRNLLEPY